eukprot:3539305-Rhodomonas_salina.1
MVLCTRMISSRFYRLQASTTCMLTIFGSHRVSQGAVHLVLLVGGVDFLWAVPSKLKSSAEALIDQFILLTGLNIMIQSISVDYASEFACSV